MSDVVARRRSAFPLESERPDDLVFVCQRCHGMGIEFKGEETITCNQCGGHGYFDEEERLRWQKK